MDWLQKAREALAMIQRGREALEQVTDAVKDGSAALNTNDQAELDRMLQREEQETAAAIQSGRDAIADYRSGR